MVPTCVLLQPVNGRTRQMSPITLDKLRLNILALLTFMADCAGLHSAEAIVLVGVVV